MTAPTETAPTGRPPADLPPITAQDHQPADQAAAAQDNQRGFRAHATVYLLTTALMIVFNLVFVSDSLWFPFPLLFWGLGLGMHYLFGVRLISRETSNRQATTQRRAAHNHAA